MDKEISRYIIFHFPNLLTANEKIALTHARSLEQLYNTDINGSRADFFRRRGLLTEDPTILELLKDGYDAFERRVCTRILKECPEKVFFNYCPACQRLARTPYARQCRYCCHDWHYLIAAKFAFNSSFSLTSRGFYLLGEVTTGEVKTGQYIDLTMLGLAIKPSINSIEYAVKDLAGQRKTFIALGTHELNEEEMNYLKKKGSFGTPLDVLKARI